MLNKVTLPIVLIVILSACNGGAGRSDDASKVFKYAGENQCENNGVALEDMQRELTDAGIAVSCAQRAGDGYAYAACCGCASGVINVYSIDGRDVPAAADIGFEPISTLPDYQDSACE